MKSRYFVYLLEKKLFEEWILKKAQSLISEEEADSITVSDYTPKDCYNVYVVADRLDYNFAQFINQFETYNDFKVGWKIKNTNGKKIVRKYMLYMDKEYIDEFEDAGNSRKSIIQYKDAKTNLNDIIEGLEDLYTIFEDMKNDGWYFSLSKKYDKIISQINTLKTEVIKNGFIKDYTGTVKNLTNQIGNLATTDQQKYENERKIKEYTRLLATKFNTAPHKADEIYIPQEIEGLPALVLRMIKKGMSDIEIIEKLGFSHQLDKPILGALLYPKNSKIADYLQFLDGILDKYGLSYDKKTYKLVKKEEKNPKK